MFVLFSYIWAAHVLHACQTFIIIVAVCTWYFSVDSDSVGHAQIRLGASWAFTKNFGSLCLGAGIMTITDIINGMIQEARKSSKGGRDSGAVLILVCISCCCSEMLNMLGKNAYMQMGLHGTPFCESAKEAFYLIRKHFCKFFAIDALTGVLDLIGILFMLITSLGCTYALLLIFNPDSELAPLALGIVFVFTILISGILFNIIHTASDTILHCYMLDMDL